MNPMLATAPPIALLAPEILLAVGGMVVLLIGVFRGEGSGRAMGWLAFLILLAAGALVLWNGGMADAGEPATLFGGDFISDPFTRFMKTLALVGAAVALLMAFDFDADARLQTFEFPVLIIYATLGMLVMISAGGLIALYVGLELQSLSLYVVAAIRRSSVRSSEAGLKYFVLGALSSGMLLYGCSLIYGFTGTTSFTGIASAVQASGGAGHVDVGILFGLVFLLAGLAFKISAVPFHMWTPDVYEGAPTPVTAFFAAAPKMAAMALLLRVTLDAFAGIASQWQQIVVFLSIASMLLGAFAAIGQTNIKRLMAYSSIGHMGYALVGLAAGSSDGTHAVLVYLAIYLVMTLGTFACILSMRRSEGMVEDISELAGLSRTAPTMAFFLGVLLFSLAGIPPLAGFFAKFYVFLTAIQAGLYPLAIIGVLASVVGAYYYLRIVKIMYFDEPAEAFEAMPARLRVVLVVSGLAVILYAAWPTPLLKPAAVAASTLF